MHVCEKKSFVIVRTSTTVVAAGENRVEKKLRVGMCLKVVKQFFVCLLFGCVAMLFSTAYTLMCTLSTQQHTDERATTSKKNPRDFFSFPSAMLVELN